MGDPGILANLIYPKSKKRTQKIGIVPHYVDEDLPIMKKLRKDRRFLIISPRQTPRKVAEQISSCRCIISSSLHGLIFADSYNIPNAHVIFSDKVIGGNYKFLDYCSGVGKNYQMILPEDIFDDECVRRVMRNYQPIKQKRRRQRALIRSFPYK